MVGTDDVQRWEKEIHAAHPRLATARSLIDEIVKRAAGTEAAAPRYSFPAGLLRERQADGITSLERAVAASVWGE